MNNLCLYLFVYVLIKDQESAVCISDSHTNAASEKDPWELPEFAHTSIPWRGITNSYLLSIAILYLLV